MIFGILALLCLNVFIWVRNGQVYFTRIEVLASLPPGINIEVHDRHGYSEMLLKFWKPVKSFYPEVFK